MSRAAGEHERRGARAARVDLPRGTARSREPLLGEHVPEEPDQSRTDRGAPKGAGTCAPMRGAVGGETPGAGDISERPYPLYRKRYGGGEGGRRTPPATSCRPARL